MAAVMLWIGNLPAVVTKDELFWMVVHRFGLLPGQFVPQVVQREAGLDYLVVPSQSGQCCGGGQSSQVEWQADL